MYNLKSAGLTITALLSLHLLPLPVVAAQHSAPSIALAETSATLKLLETAKRHYRRAEFKQAIALYQQVLTQAQQSDDRPNQIEALLQLGDIDFWIGDVPQAEAKFQQALKLSRETKDRNREGSALALLSAVYRSRQNYAKANDLLKESLAIAQQTKDRKLEARSRFFMGIILHLQQQYPQSLETFQQALKLDQELNDLDEIAHIQDWLAITYLRLKDLKQAEITIQRQQKLSRDTGYVLAEYDGLNTIASLQQERKQPDQVLQTYQKQLEIAQSTNNPWFQRNSLTNIVSTYVVQGQAAYKQGQYQSALDLYKKALLPIEQAVAIGKGLKLGFTREAQLVQVTVYGGIVNAHIQLKQYDLALVAIQKAQAIAKETGDPKTQQLALVFALSVYLTIENSLDDPTQYDKKLEVDRQIISLLQKVKKPQQESLYLQGIGYIYQFQGRLPEALEAYQQGLTRARESRDLRYEALALLNIGNLYDTQANYPQALTLYEQARQIFSQPRFKYEADLEIIAINNIAAVYRKQGQYAQALTVLQQSLEIAQKYYETYASVTLESIRAECLRDVTPEDSDKSTDPTSFDGYCAHPDQMPTGDLLNSFKFRITSNTKTGRASVGVILGNIASVYSSQGELQKALTYHQKSLAIYRELGNRRRESIVLINIGLICRDLAVYPKAINNIQRALKIATELGDLDSEGTFRSYLGSLKSDIGRYAEAAIEYQQSLKIARQLKQRYEEGSVLTLIGGDYSSQGKYADAIANYQQALKIQQDINVPPNVIFSLANLGNTYARLGQYSKAIELHQQALALARKIGARQTEASVLIALGTDDRLQGKFDSALSYQQQALSIAQSIQARLTESTALNNIGKIYNQQSQPQKALPVLQQALSSAQQTGRKPDQAAILKDLGQAQLQLGNFSEAQSNLQQAIVLAKETGDAPIEAQALSTLGQLFAKNQPELAIVFYKQSVKTTEDIRKGLKTLTKDQQQSYTETVADTYRKLADLLLKRDRVLEAQQVLDLLKLQELDNYLRNVRGTAQKLYELPPEQAILKKYNALNQSAITLGQELAQLRQISEANRTPAQQQRITELVQLQDDLNQQFNQFQTRADVVALVEQLSRTAKTQTVDLANLDRLRDDLRRLNAVIIYPLVLDDRLELIITTPDSPPLRRTVNVKREDLNRAIAQFRQALQNPTVDAKSTAQQFYAWLIKPLENDLKQAKPTTIIYAPDAQLRYIPIAALHDGNQWLAQRYSINNITAQSLTDFTAKPQSKPRILAGAFAQGKYTIGALSFQGLPFAGREVATLKTLLPNTKNLIDAAFSRSATTTQMNEYNILHLATHAAFVPGAASNSFILFGDGNIATLEDVKSWTLNNLDLVVLSACETGLGGKLGENGEEVLGLGYQFQSRGARATIASLWQVDDGGTQVLMDNFYANLQAGKTKAEALHQAQLTLITGKAQSSGNDRSATLVTRWQGQLPSKVIAQLNHPYYWAPFILIGNGL